MGWRGVGLRPSRAAEPLAESEEGGDAGRRRVAGGAESVVTAAQEHVECAGVGSALSRRARATLGGCARRYYARDDERPPAQCLHPEDSGRTEKPRRVPKAVSWLAPHLGERRESHGECVLGRYSMLHQRACVSARLGGQAAVACAARDVSRRHDRRRDAMWARRL